MSQPSKSARRLAAEDNLRGTDFLERLGLIWSLFFYLSLALSLVGSFSEGLAPWQLGALLALSAASLALFHLIYARFFSNRRGWPMPMRTAWLYFGGQLLLLGSLLAIDGNFIGLCYAVLGQVFGALPPRRWPLPATIILAMICWPIGLYESLFRGDWLNFASFVFSMAVLIVMALLVSRLYSQRYQLLHVVDELRQAKAAIEAGAAQQEELAVLRERTRLAREMHDSLGHALVSVNIKLEAAQRLYRVEPTRGDSELEATRALVREAMGGLRRSLHDLRAPLPHHENLPNALRCLAAEVSARGLVAAQTELATPGLPPPAVAEALWMIAREALTNVERHAAAAHACVTLGCEDGAWVLRVSDDGAGIRAANLSRPGHFGIIGMRERAVMLGGNLSVARRAEGGTLVEARVPAAD